MKNKISNTIVILLAIAVFIGIGFIIKKDINKVEEHLTKCRKECYPAQVAEQFSKRGCMCMPIIIEKELDAE